MLKLVKVIGSGVAPDVEKGESRVDKAEAEVVPAPIQTLAVGVIKGTTRTLLILLIPLETKKLKGLPPVILLN
jgi:hypothetical protein